MEPAIYIVSGISGAGKTTVSRLLAATFERGVHIESDLLQKFILTEGLWPRPDEEAQEEAMRQLRLRAHNACILAMSYFDAGFSPVIDDIVIGSRFDDFPRCFEAVHCASSCSYHAPRSCAGATLHVRRSTYSTPGGISMKSRATRRVGLWLDTSEMTAEETVAAIRQRAGESVIVPR